MTTSLKGPVVDHDATYWNRHALNFGSFDFDSSSRWNSGIDVDETSMSRKLVAEEWLFAQNYRGRSEDLPDSIKNVRPLQDFAGRPGPAMTDLSRSEAILVHFPMETSHQCGTFARLWIFKNLAGENGDEGHSCYVSLARPGSQIDGRSWELALAVGKRLLDLPSLETRVRRRVSLYWLYTGIMDADLQISHVKIGNKISQEALKGSPRTKFLGIIAPADCQQDSGPSEDGMLPITPFADLDSAWRFLTGGMKEPKAERVLWPSSDKVESYHATVSPAFSPILAGALATGASKVSLWVDDQMRKYALFIKEVLTTTKVREWLQSQHFGVPVVDIEGLASADLAEAESIMLASRIHAAGKIVLFNITGGNFLMKEAVGNVARLNHRIWRIYRDVNCPDSNEFHLLRQSEGLRRSDRLVNFAPAKAIVWKQLFPAPGDLLIKAWEQRIENADEAGIATLAEEYATLIIE